MWTPTQTQHFAVIRGSFHASCTALSRPGTSEEDIKKAVETLFEKFAERWKEEHEVFLEIESIELHEEPPE